MINVDNISFCYAKSGEQILNVLSNVNININKGEFVAVLGHNGSGKSTFAKHLNAILVPDCGKVTVDGIDTADETRLWDVRSKVAMVFQNPDNQIVATIVEDDVAFACENLGYPPDEIRLRVDFSLDAVGMTEFKSHAPHLLSGGQKQRIAIAGVIAISPDVIVLDEPTAMLDPTGRSEVMRTLEDLNRNHNITIVLITHNMDEAVRADRVVVMDAGKVVMDDVPKKVFSNVQMLKDIGLDVPQVTELACCLRNRGVHIQKDILYVDECVEELLRICR